MRPTTPELITAIVAALESQVAPHVADKWAASALRSATQLLNHIALRSEGGAPVLGEDNLDVREVLETLLPRLALHAGLSDARDAVSNALAEPDPDARNTSGLDARNETYQAAVEKLLGHAEVRALDDGAVLRSLREYLRRRLKREHPLYFPVFTSPPF
jgi:hypothetical protein